MQLKRPLKLIIAFIGFLFFVNHCFAQRAVNINDKVDQHIFSFKEIQSFEDTSRNLTIDQVSNPVFKNKFKPSITSTPQTAHLNSAYWYRIRINYDNKSEKNWILEFFDQTIDKLSIYSPDEKGNFKVKNLGDDQLYKQRDFKHKNFVLPLKQLAQNQTFYIRVQSHETADVIIVLRSVNWFVQYANDEYFTFGLFYGMIFIFAFYNLLMFGAVRQKQYLYYVLYLLSVAMYEMCTDGLAYQYLWPASPVWNQYAFAVALCAISVFCLLFTKELLHTKKQAPLFNKLILWVIALRLLFFGYCLVFDKSLLNYKFIEFIPLVLAFLTGIYVNHKGYRPARFFVIGYGSLCLGFFYKILIMLHFDWLNIDAVTYYSLTISFIVEMFFLSLAIGDRVRMLKRKKDKAQRQIIAQMKENEVLQLQLNQELEKLVAAKTQELNSKKAIVEAQNKELLDKNELLIKQSEEISRMNVLLEKDNEELHTGMVKVTRSRVMSEDVDFDEFGKIYPDSESCYSFLANLKWQEGYSCRRCNHTHYFNGHTRHSRRCANCDYDESVTAYTIFQNSRIPITKAFYLLFLLYSTKGKISSHKLAEILEIRQGTCWSYSAKIKKLMEDKKKELKQGNKAGWSKLVLE